MHQRKTNDSANGGGGGVDEEAPPPSAPQGRRRPRRRRANQRSGNHRLSKLGSALGGSSALLLPMGTLAMLLFGILWIRALWKIGSLEQNQNQNRNQNVGSVIDSHSGEQPRALGIADSATNHDDNQNHGNDNKNNNSNPNNNNENENEKEPLFKLFSEEAPSCSSPILEGPEAIDVTLVTQLSDDRLWMMEHHCERYGPHPISISVYTHRTLADIREALEAMGCRIEGGGSGSNHNHNHNHKTNKNKNNSNKNENNALVSVRVLDASKHGARNDYPVNDLRNLALRGVATSHILYADVDFWPSEKLYESLTESKTARKRLWDDPRLAVVVPAFQLERTRGCRDETRDCREAHVPIMPRTLEDLRNGFREKAVATFDPFNRGGHGSTDYRHWIEHQQGEVVSGERNGDGDGDDPDRLYDIPCLKSHRYEPFLVLRYCRELTPPFQPAFTGYGKNKMTWTMQVAASGFVFAQLGSAYLVHYPHAISESRRRWNEAPKELRGKNGDANGDGHANYNVRKPRKSDGDLGFDRYHRGRVDDLYLRFKDWLRETIPPERARMRMCGDAQDDDSKLWVDPDRKKAWKRL